MTNYFNNLVTRITNLSHNKKLPFVEICSSEWKVVIRMKKTYNLLDDESKKHSILYANIDPETIIKKKYAADKCICDHDIVNQHYIYNIYTHVYCHVGSKCIDKFGKDFSKAHGKTKRLDKHIKDGKKICKICRRALPDEYYNMEYHLNHAIDHYTSKFDILHKKIQQEYNDEFNYIIRKREYYGQYIYLDDYKRRNLNEYVLQSRVKQLSKYINKKITNINMDFINKLHQSYMTIMNEKDELKKIIEIFSDDMDIEFIADLKTKLFSCPYNYSIQIQNIKNFNNKKGPIWKSYNIYMCKKILSDINFLNSKILNKWEIDFIKSIIIQDYSLTVKQKRIYVKCMRKLKIYKKIKLKNHISRIIRLL